VFKKVSTVYNKALLRAWASKRKNKFMILI